MCDRSILFNFFFFRKIKIFILVYKVYIVMKCFKNLEKNVGYLN